MQKIKNWLQQNTPVLLLLFVLAVGLTGAINADVSKVIYGLSLVAFLIFCFNDIKLWIQQHSEAKTYFKILVFFTLYGFLLIAVWSFLPNKYNLKPTYGGIEELLFNYVLVPFFSLVIGLYLNQKMFERAMMLFSVCTALSGLFLLFVYFDLHILLNTPAVFFDNVLQCRFMSCGNRVSWIAILLKDYSFFPALGALVAAPFIVKYKGWYKLLAIVLLLINTLLLFLTINRGTIIGFVLALLIMFFYSLRNFGWRKKILYSLGGIILCYIVIRTIPQSISDRFIEIFTEGEAFFLNGDASHSVSIRLTIWKALLSHAHDFWLFGDGPIYATQKLRLYLTDAGFDWYVQTGFIYHNQYLAYFHHYGIAGLLFLPVMLLYPIYAMIKQRKFSAILTGILLLFLFALVEDRYLAKATIVPLLFFVYFSFFQLDKWRAVEHK